LKGQICFCSYSKSKDISVWEEALKQLQSVGHAEMEDIARSALKLSYKWLANDENKAIFFLSAVLETLLY
jgi:hypothetical protein